MTAPNGDPGPAARPRGRPETRHTDTVPAEARPYQGLRAGVITRTMAAVIDFATVLAALGGTWLALFGLGFMLNPTDFAPPTYDTWVVLVAGAFYCLVYLTVAWATTGRTVGDHLLGLRVVNFRGERVRFIGALLRAAFCITFSIGLFWAAVSRQNRSVQDVVLRTSVIYDWDVGPVPSAPAPAPPS